jgi:two-component system heavy metal sensor histidine kinase CusS
MKSLLRLQSLSQRLSWWLAIQSFFGLGAVCLAVYMVTAWSLAERQEETLAQKEGIVRHLLEGTGEHALDPSSEHPLNDFLIGHENFRLIVRTPQGQRVFPAVEPAADGTQRTTKTFEVRPPEAARTLRATLSMDISTDLLHLRRLAITLAVAAVVGALVVSVGGFWIVHLGLAPVRRLASQARSLSVDNLHQRLDGTGQPSELTPLIEQFNGLLSRLDQAYTQLEGFNADVAHELRTPLATLLASNELALRHPASFDMGEVLASNLEELHRLTGIVNDMLFLSRADRGSAARRAFTPSLASVVEQVADYHEASLAEAGLELTIEGDASGHIDEPLLRRALSNLIGNATQHATPGTRVQVRIAALSPLRVHVAVVNTGETIPPEVAERIFDRFFRASASREHSQSNHGLGLAITAAIARMHGGCTTVRSRDGTTEIGLELVCGPADA